MKLNVDCIRDVLLTMEDIPLQSNLTPKQLKNTLTKYTSDDIDYSCQKLLEAEYITGVTKNCEGTLTIVKLNDITFNGHQFLANIRQDNIWNGVKEIGFKIGATSLNAFTQIASNVVTEIIKSYFNLH